MGVVHAAAQPGRTLRTGIVLLAFDVPSAAGAATSSWS